MGEPAADQRRWQSPIPKAVQKQVEEGERALKDLQEGKLIIHNPDLGKPQEEPEPADEKEERPEDDTWEHKYNVLRGKYDSEGRSMRQTIAGLEGKVTSLTDTVANLNDLLVTRRPTDEEPSGEPEVKPSTGADLVLDKDEFAGYGSEMEKAVDIINRLTAEVQELKGKAGKIDRIEAQTTTAAREKFDTDLDALSPGWREINQDPDFYNGWLRSNWDGRRWVRISPAHQKLIDASNEMDAEAVADIFNAYRQIKGIKTVGPDESETPSQEDLVVPDIGTAPSSTTRPRPKTVSLEQYQKAVKDKIRGTITEEQFDAIAKAFYTTQQTGRK